MKILFIVLAGLALGIPPVAAAPIPTSRSGLVLFTLPVDRQRVEEIGYTALKTLRPDGYEIRIRTPFDLPNSAADVVQMHAQWLATAFNVQPASMPQTFRHASGFDVALQTFYLRGADGRIFSMLVAVLKSGTKGAVVEFVATSPQSPQAIEQMASFIDGCRLAHTEVLVPGTPRLTVYDVEETLDVLQWLIDAPLPSTSRAAMRSEIVSDWKAKDAGTIAQVHQLLDFRDQVVKLPAAQQNLARRQNEIELVTALRTNKESTSALLLAAYDSAHPPIASGSPALTRQQADAALDLFYFMAGQLEGVQATATPAAKTEWAGTLARAWPTLPQETRASIAAMPVTWALTLAVWPQMTPAARAQTEAAFAQIDVVRGLRTNFAAARMQASAASMLYPTAMPPAQPAAGGPGYSGGLSATPSPAPSSNAVDVSQQIAKNNQSYQSMSSWSTTSYNSTINLMAAYSNMSGPRVTVR